ncbi:hypothetical protein [Macrococcus capreoli]|uniref:hypothetical protein n=1 Tax=Macrococcus capreoli TaxID=2982690 RepID=UPI003EE7CB3F
MCEIVIDNDKEIQVDISSSEVTVGKQKGNIIELSGKQFSDPRLLGLQRKGFIYIENEDSNLYTEKFVKIDKESINKPGKFKDNYDVLYSSVTEDIVSRLLDNMIYSGTMNSLTYTFHLFDMKGEKITGTTSNNYIKDNYLEIVLSYHNPRADEDAKYNPEEQYFPIKFNDYHDEIINCYDNLSIFNSMVKYYKSIGVNEEYAKKFVIQQAAFDILIANTDRRKNSTNSIAIKSFDRCIPINLDYGRSLPVMFKEEHVEKYANMDEETWQDFVEGLSDLSSDEFGVISAEGRIVNNIEFLVENGFEKFKININKLKRDLEVSCERIQRLKPELYEFAKVKAGILIARLESEELSVLWEASDEENNL